MHFKNILCWTYENKIFRNFLWRFVISILIPFIYFSSWKYSLARNKYPRSQRIAKPRTLQPDLKGVQCLFWQVIRPATWTTVNNRFCINGNKLHHVYQIAGKRINQQKFSLYFVSWLYLFYWLYLFLIQYV